MLISDICIYLQIFSGIKMLEPLHIKVKYLSMCKIKIRKGTKMILDLLLVKHAENE